MAVLERGRPGSGTGLRHAGRGGDLPAVFKDKGVPVGPAQPSLTHP